MLTAVMQSPLADVAEKVLAGERLSFEDGVRLYQSDDLNAVGYLANQVRERLNGNRAYWVRNQHINYTNVCNKGCKFCSFYAKKGGPHPYVLSPEDVRRKVLQYIDYPVHEVHMVAGIDPRLPYDYYLDILRAVKDVRPEAHVKAFTMVEIAQIQAVGGKSLEATLLDLKAAGLGSLPGGGAEVFGERLHQELYAGKIDGNEWLRIARTAHRLGIKSNATMLYGHVETPEERVDHLLRLRDAQDETGGFLTFIPLAFAPENTELSDLPPTTGIDDLKNVAVARLMLDNFDHIKSFWIMITPPMAQLSLWYGADDIDGTIIEYEITHVGTTSNHQALTQQQLLDMIHEAGRDPVERDTLYRPIAEPMAA